MRRTGWSVITAFLILTPLTAAADKTDVLVFLNGDRLTGEVRSLERGKLRFNTDATGTISIEWDDVAFLSSKQDIQVETEEGIRHFGHLAVSDQEGTINVETSAGTVNLTTGNVVRMTPIEGTVRERLEGDITAGYNFAKANEVKSIVLGIDAKYRTETRSIGVTIDATESDSADTDSSSRQTFATDYRRYWADRWLTGAVLRLEANDELGLDLRTSLGAGGGRILRQTSSTELEILGGLRVSREDVAGDVSSENTLEAFGTVAWDWFRYDTPELDLSTKLQVIPSLSESGRVRAQLDVNLKWEIVEDLFWQLSFYDIYDSDPPAADAEKNDYGITTSLGWEF